MSLHVERQGSGPDVVLIHGWGMNGRVWRGVLPALAGRFRVHAVDLPGHGQSAWDGRAFTLPNLVETVAQAVPDGAAWVGWSLGGMVALQAAAQASAARVIAIAANARFTQSADWSCALAPEILESFAADLSKDYAGTLMRFVALQCRGSEYAREELRQLRQELASSPQPAPQALAGGLALLAEADLRSVLGRIACPVLLLLGERDTLVPAAAGEAVLAHVPQGRLTVVKGAGHAPFLSHSSLFLATVTEFLADESI